MKCECVGDARALKRLRMPTNQRLALLFNNAIGPERRSRSFQGAKVPVGQYQTYLLAELTNLNPSALVTINRLARPHFDQKVSGIQLEQNLLIG